MAASKLKALPAQDELKRLLDYEPHTGRLIWRARPRSMFSSDGYCKQWNERYAGNQAGRTTCKGYRSLKIHGEAFAAHRVVMKLLTGLEPPEVDHINGDRSDNRASNLRPSDGSQNNLNLSLARNNRSGFAGVREAKPGKWVAYLYRHSQQIHLGTYDSFNAAVKARLAGLEAHGFTGGHGKKLQHSYRNR